MSKFWGWVANKINDREKNNVILMPSLKTKDSMDLAGENKLEFTVHFAEGGVVLQKHSYDPIKDRSRNKLMIISDDKDIAKEIGEFVAVEILRS
jgi:hypothetical protein